MSLPRAVFQGAWVFSVAALLALGCGSDDDGDGANAGGAGSSGVGGSASPIGGSSNAGSAGASSGAGGSAGSAGRGGGSASGGTAGSLGNTCTADSPITCADSSTVQGCQNGVIEKVTCDEVCSSVGFDAGPCVAEPAPAGCDCGDMSNVPCLRGVAAFCNCVKDTTSPCTDDQRVQLYLGCFSEDPMFAPIACFGDYINEAVTMVDCAGAAACFPDAPGEGGSGGSG